MTSEGDAYRAKQRRQAREDALEEAVDVVWCNGLDGKEALRFLRAYSRETRIPLHRLYRVVLVGILDTLREETDPGGCPDSLATTEPR